MGGVWGANGGWVLAEDLKIGDVLINVEGNPNPIDSIEYIEGEVMVYNLQVEGTHTYYAGGVGVHNRLDSTRIQEKIM